jgi:hypothetical protein
MKKIKVVESSKFKLHGFFLLSETIWWKEYFIHIEAELKKVTTAQFPLELKDPALELEQFKKILKNVPPLSFNDENDIDQIFQYKK